MKDYEQHPSEVPDPPLNPASAPPIIQPTSIQCPNCGNVVPGAIVGTLCQNCGLKIGPGSFTVQNQAGSGKAATALVLGIISIAGCCAYGLPAIICGPLAIRYANRAKAESPANQPNGMATAGFVCGIIGSVMGGIFVALVIIGFVAEYMDL